MIRPGKKARGDKTVSPQFWGLDTDPAELREQSLRNIRRMQILGNRRLWVIATFLALAILAYRGFDLIPSLSVEFREVLGAAPPVRLIQVALVVYGFSAAVLILARMARDTAPGNSWLQLGYLAVFFVFFNFAEALDENFWAVFTAGGMILGLEAFHGWSYWMAKIRHEQERLSRFSSRSHENAEP
jgi:O-antigen/teichoic acid export membrane protein